MTPLSRRGNAILEAAFALPAIAAVLLGILDFSQLFAQQAAASAAARTGVQAVMDHASLITSSEDGFEKAQKQMSQAASGGEIKTSRLCYCANDDGTLGSERPCPVSCRNARMYVRVEAKAAVSPVIRYPGFPSSAVSTAVVRVQ